jgi:hypothetical protein
MALSVSISEERIPRHFQWNSAIGIRGYVFIRVIRVIRGSILFGCGLPRYVHPAFCNLVLSAFCILHSAFLRNPWFNSLWLRLAASGIPAAKPGPQKNLQKDG